MAVWIEYADAANGVEWFATMADGTVFQAADYFAVLSAVKASYGADVTVFTEGDEGDYDSANEMAREKQLDAWYSMTYGDA